ncbi:MAG: response regulator [Candidatus Schekmanbacteria bacterium]|nr:MAG: response regulator [Candidatus Schekmanbacteria bacterium]
MDVLIVDDSSVMRKILTRSLRQSNLDIGEIIEASDGEEALNKIKENSVQLVLCDVNMPKLNGLEFVKKVKENNISPDTKIIMVTSEGGLDTVNQAVENGAKGFIVKPFSAEDFKKKIEHLCAA